MTEEELKRRMREFALRVLKLVNALPNTAAGRAVAGQLVRSGMSVGANYRAACRGRSRAEFLSKLGIAEEEADETVWWLEIITESGLLAPTRVRSLLAEANELTAILVASRITAKRHSGPPIANLKSKI